MLKNRAELFFPRSPAPALALLSEVAPGEQEQEQEKEYDDTGISVAP
jgi:hypothetical protein